jgi:hypothetical protein
MAVYAQAQRPREGVIDEIEFLTFPSAETQIEIQWVSGRYRSLGCASFYNEEEG